MSSQCYETHVAGCIPSAMTMTEKKMKSQTNTQEIFLSQNDHTDALEPTKQ